jgi:hypothetical protein
LRLPPCSLRSPSAIHQRSESNPFTQTPLRRGFFMLFQAAKPAIFDQID